jgi:hypothetical protein
MSIYQPTSKDSTMQSKLMMEQKLLHRLSRSKWQCFFAIRFATFKTSVKSDFHQAGIAYPKTIDEAFLQTSNWELDHPSAVAPPLTRTSTSHHANTNETKDTKISEDKEEEVDFSH